MNSLPSNPFVHAYFIKGIIGTDELCDDQSRTQIAFVGRSNVGKSSLINAVLGRKNLVKSSGRPGKTTEINFFGVDEDYYFVDLPGYGFARMGEKQREKLRKLILWYLMYVGVVRRKIFIVLDAQVGLTDFDREVGRELVAQGEDVWLVVNKIDKLNQKARHTLAQEIEGELVCDTLYTSVTKGRGISEVRRAIVGE